MEQLVTDIFEPFQDDPRRPYDHIFDPFTGNRHSWIRVTTFAKSIMDTYKLNEWQQRMAAKGLSMRPDLLERVVGLDVKADWKWLNSIVEEAKDAAGHKDAANWGTAIHNHIESLTTGHTSLGRIPDEFRLDISAYMRALRDYRLRAVPEMTERITCIPNYGVAGRLDGVLQESSGDFVIGDVKSGSSLQYGQVEICVQLALYAHGVNMAGVWGDGQWLRVPEVRTDYAIVMHVPAGLGTCALYKVDIEAGWEVVKLCADVRYWRGRKDLFTPYEIPADGPDWESHFRSVRTRDEAYALYLEAEKFFGPGSDELDRLVSLGLETLKDIALRDI